MQTPEDDHQNDAPDVPCVLELDPALGKVAVEGDPIHEAVCANVLRDIAGIMHSLGIPGSPDLQIIPFQDTPPENALLRFSVHGQVCVFSQDVLLAIWSCLTNRPWSNVNETPADMLTQLQGIPEEPVERISRIFYDFLGYACLEMIAKQPSVLLSNAQIEQYIEQLTPLVKEETLAFNAAQLFPILRTVLDCKISVSNTAAVASSLSAIKEQSPEIIAESLIELLLSKSNTRDIVVYLSRDYLHRLTTCDVAAGPDRFVRLRDDLWRSTGVVYPSIHFKIDDERYASPRFAFQINHLLTIPWVGLAEANEQYNELEYFVQCLGYVLQENNHCFVHRQFVEERLQEQKRSYPALIDAISARKISREYIARVLRTLADENRSIKDMRLILERLLDYAYMSDDPTSNAALDVSFTASGKIVSTWFTDPMHVVSYVREVLPTTPYAD